MLWLEAALLVIYAENASSGNFVILYVSITLCMMFQEPRFMKYWIRNIGITCNINKQFGLQRLTFVPPLPLVISQ